MRDAIRARAAPDEASRADAEPRRNSFVQTAPGPESPDVPDRIGRARGMAIAVAGGSVFWAAVGAAVWLLTRG